MPDPRTAFVLAGGGTKGAFEVGAVAHLVGSAGRQPDVITAASAGAIIGSKLAQARGTDELRARVEELRHDLLAMSDIAVVFGRQPWLDDLHGTPFGDAIERFLEMRPTTPDLDPPDLDPPDPAGADPGSPGTDDVATDVAHRVHHRRRSFHALQHLLATAPALNHARRDAASSASSFLTLDPLGRALRGADPSSTIAPLEPALVARPGVQLRLAVTALDLGVTRYVTESGAVVDADAVTPSPHHPAPVELAEAVLASSSAPMVFPPRRLGDVVYSDGGIAQNVPVAAAAALGAVDIYAVVATPLATPPAAIDDGHANFLQIHLRSSQIMFSDHQRANLSAAPAGTELTTIAPTVDLVGAFEVNEGLMRIDMDYGWLRASDALAPLDDRSREQAMALTDRVVVARDRAWFAEDRLWRGEAPPGTLDEIRRLKEVVHEALGSRASLGLPAPAGSEEWARTWESHAVPRPRGVPDAPDGAP